MEYPLWFFLVTVNLFASPVVDTLNMMTSPQAYSKNAGDNVSFRCEYRFYSFNLFYNPVIWKKVQWLEETQVNILSNIQPPFRDTLRFKVTYVDKPPRYNWELRILDLSIRDSGNYTCEIHDEHSRVISNVTHNLIVHAPVKSIKVIDSTKAPYKDVQHVTFIENTPSAFGCVALGGYPPPRVEIRLGTTDMTDQFGLSSFLPESRSKGEEKGLRSLSYTVVRWTNSFIPAAGDDLKSIWCYAKSAGFSDAQTAATLFVKYSPRVICEHKESYMMSLNTSLSCTILARPLPFAIHWLLDISNGTKYTTTQRRMNNTSMLVTLRIWTHTQEMDFRSYGLLVENDISARTGYASLTQKYTTAAPTEKPRYVEGSDMRRKYYYRIITRGSAASNRPTYIPALFIFIWLLCSRTHILMVDCYFS